MSALKNYVLPVRYQEYQIKKDRGKTTLLKNYKKYEYGDSTGYEA